MAEERRQKPREEIENVADVAAQRAVERMLPKMREIAAETSVNLLIGLGIPAHDPIEMQKRMLSLEKAMTYEANPQAQKRRDWVDTQMVRCNSIAAKVITTVVGLLTIGGVYALWDGIRAALRSGGHT